MGYRLTRSDGVVIIERTVGGPNQEDCKRETKVADAVDEKGFLACGGRFRFLIPETD